MSRDTSSSMPRRTILFVDVVASTALYAHLGDVAAQARVSSCLEALSSAAAGRSGRVVKSLGDGLLVVYEHAEAAVMAAFELVALAPTHRLRVRVGLHSGEVLEDDGDVFGRVVNAASRICSLAKASEVLASRDVHERLSASTRESSRRVPGLSLKGLEEPLEVFVLVQQDSSATLAMTRTVRRPELSVGDRLEFALGERVWPVGTLTEFTLGRGAFNDLVLDRPQVSRRHAHVSHRRGKYVLRDESVNGTWIVPDSESGLHLLREESVLHGTGQLYLGAAPGRPESLAIRYRSFA